MFRIPIEVADGGDMVYRTGTLAVTGLLFLAMDPPAAPPAEWREAALWITSDGAFPDPRVKTGIKLPDGLPSDAFCNYLFASNTNAFIIVAATGATFEWSLDKDGLT